MRPLKTTQPNRYNLYANAGQPLLNLKVESLTIITHNGTYCPGKCNNYDGKAMEFRNRLAPASRFSERIGE